VWVCFLARGAFYCSFLPLWEGYDEWAHFSFVERIASSGRLLVDRSEPVSREVRASMELAPAPWNSGKPQVSGDEYWRLPAAEREERGRVLHAMPLQWSRQPDLAGPPIYEALQPPLYYWICSIAYRFLANRPLLERVFALRYLSIFICSLAIPIVFLVARRVSGSALTACFVITLFAVLPELMIDVGRVGNECLAIVLYAWLTLLALPPGAERAGSRRRAVWTGVALGLGLLTKAYFLTAIPALTLVYLWRMRRSADRRDWAVHASTVFAIALGIAGWWYLRNRLTTGSWSGLLETTKLVHYSRQQFWTGARQVDWRNAVDSTLLSHIWFGGTSSLQVRSWMYHLLFLIAAAGVVGVAAALVKDAKRRRLIFPLVLIYGFFWIGQLYYVLLLFLTKGASTSMGWYVYSVIAAEATLLVVGLQSLTPVRLRGWVVAAVIFLIGALDLYTVDLVSIPYYVGLTAHRVRDGALAAFHIGELRGFGIGEVLKRLASMKPFWLRPELLGFMWAIYAAATLVLVSLGFWLALAQARGSEAAVDSGLALGEQVL
jgi:4-amino-4-deoxy-L-arabinose transferase-like glycosyltransferase